MPLNPLAWIHMTTIYHSFCIINKIFRMFLSKKKKKKSYSETHQIAPFKNISLGGGGNALSPNPL